MGLIIIIAILALFAFLYLQMMQKASDDQNEEETDVILFDDTISPESINQGITIQLNRIHKRGLEELIRSFGTKWKQPISYYCKALCDTVTWESLMFDTWDTGYLGWEANRFVEDEIEIYPLTFQIIEINNGLLRDTEIIMEEFSIEYNFKTGRWTGKDSWNDSTGYGHYVGSSYEMWFDIKQIEHDGDQIPYWTEINILGTDPLVNDEQQDPDQDGIPTSWEWKWGYDPFSWENHSSLDPDQDGIENIEEFQMRTWCANPYYKDIYLEIDMMEEPPGLFALDHIFYKESQYMLMDVFTPHHITVHIDDGWANPTTIGGGERLPYTDEYISPISGLFSEFYKNHFSDERKGVFRYVIIHHDGGWCFPQTNQLHPDVLSIPCRRDYFRSVFFPPAITPKAKRLGMAILVTHELGHSLNLNPYYCEGIDNASQVGRNNLPPLQKLQERLRAIEYWDTYESVMNYHKFGSYVLEYSDGSHGIRDADDWEQIDLTFFQKTIDEKYGIGDE